ncbi:hypothetical protein N0V83_005788 [Neocucurbitaria cava]|uniref:Orc1-like AAA ATPase domain-containing protein n=1 Tax=Neocucurbitaria cava TaxID=798079 RepID=A0A9W8Y7Z6_9PLEO|nr:hypothetical protein N0V83_005788 [Neocucurbitaria cava]
MLPDEIIAQLNTEFQCREQQLQHLAALYSSHLPSPPVLNIHGLTATGKSSILRSFFHLSRVPHVIINVRECITARHLLERIVAASLDALDEFHDEKIDRRPYARTENLSALFVNLGKMLEARGRFVLVLDAVDKLREPGGTLIAALARLGEVVPTLSLILTTNLPLTPSTLHSASVSFLHFPSYTRSQLLTILGARPPNIFVTPPSLEQFPDYTPDLAAEDDAWLWNRFLAAVYDSLTKHTGKSLISFKSCAMKLWRPFVEPVVSGQFGTRDFSRLMVNRRHLFQLEDSVLDRIITNPNTSTSTSTSTIPASATPATTNGVTTEPSTPSKPRLSKTTTATTVHDLPYYTTHLLIAAYLASYNPPRTDVTYFMKHTDKRKNKRRAPSAASFSTTSKRTPNSKVRKISRHLLTPSPFPLDRLLAIFRALLGGDEHGGGGAAGCGSGDADCDVDEFETVGSGGGGSGRGGGCVGDGGRWRVNFGWEVVRALGRRVNVEVGEYLVGGVD